jgi:hypothetical protein
LNVFFLILYFLDSNNETKSFVLVDELHLIDKNLTTLGQLLKQRMTNLLKDGLPTSNEDLLRLYQEHKVRQKYPLEIKKNYRQKYYEVFICQKDNYRG